jgi:uncharacterized protein (UPF0332 family)
MSPEIQQILAKAEDCLESAAYNLQGGYLEASVNRSYYAVFDALVALLAYQEVYPKSHKGAHAKFQELYVLNGLLPLRAKAIVADSFHKRQTGDYDFDSEISEAEATEALENAREFVAMARAYLTNAPNAH